MKDYITGQEMHDCHTNCLQIDGSPIFFLVAAAFVAGVFVGAIAASVL